MKTEGSIAAYLRLSHADEDRSEKDESNSISNQRALIRKYLQSHPDLSTMDYLEFVDDGYTGTNTSRPAFQKLLALVMAGKIQSVIVKDLSRFSREYLVLGDYVEQIFPMKGIRFISINDNYDSLNAKSYMESMNIALQSLYYAYYSKDLARKRSASTEYRMENGTFICPAPYGYITNWREHRFEIDPEPAETVRLIFSLTQRGFRTSQTANHLNSKGILTPAQYNASHPERGKTGCYWKSKQPLWTANKVRKILNNRAYLGELTFQKSPSRLLTNCSLAPAPEPKRYFQEHAHEAIIPAELFDAAHKALEAMGNDKRERHYPPQTSPLFGKLQCAHCGMKLQFRSNKAHVYCPRGSIPQSICPADSYATSDVERGVFAAILIRLQQLAALKEALEAEVLVAKNRLKPCRSRMELLQEKIASLQNQKRQSFEALASGNMDKRSFLAQKAEIQSQIDDAQSELDSLRQEEIRLASITVPSELQALTQDIEKYQEQETLPSELVEAHVHKVIVHGMDDYEVKWKYEDFPLYHPVQGEPKAPE